MCVCECVCVCVSVVELSLSIHVDKFHCASNRDVSAQQKKQQSVEFTIAFIWDHQNILMPIKFS